MKYTFLLFVLLLTLLVTLAVSCSDEAVNTMENEPGTSSTEETTASPVTTTKTPTSTTDPVVTEIPTVYTISPIEAKEMMEEGGVTIVDVRRLDEYQEGHIPGAILAPNETILTDAESLMPDKNAILLVYCRSGRRSAEAAQKLVSLGYLYVYEIGRAHV